MPRTGGPNIFAIISHFLALNIVKVEDAYIVQKRRVYEAISAAGGY